MQQTVLITGGSRGIGAAMARAFAAAGYAVAVNYHRSEAEARALVEELSSSGYSVRAFQADVSDPGQAQSLVDNVLDIFCQLDILICNAGVAWTGLLCDMTDTDYRRVLGTDRTASFTAVGRPIGTWYTGSMGVSSRSPRCGDVPAHPARRPIRRPRPV